MRCTSPTFLGSTRPFIKFILAICLLILFLQAWLANSLSIFNRDYSAVALDLNPPSLKQSIDTTVAYISRHISQKIEDSALQTDLSAEQLIARFLNDDTPMSVRKIDAWRLARLGTNESKAALLQVLEIGSNELRAAVAEALGGSPWIDAGEILSRLLSDQDRAVQFGAISGLALLGDDPAVGALQALLMADNTDEAIRSYIASRLGDVQTAAALNALIAATTISLPEETLLNVVASLAKYPFEQTGDIFYSIFTNDQANPVLITEATEALANADKQALPFLLDTVSRYPEADVRASAAWALGFHANTGNLAQPLAQLVQQEPDDEVRRRLYEALMRQKAIPSEQLLDQAIIENDPATRIAAANMLAIALHQSGTDNAVQQTFNQAVVPDLITTALGDFSTNLRYRAVFALVRAGTPDAVNALTTIGQQAEPRIAELANQGVANLADAKKP